MQFKILYRRDDGETIIHRCTLHSRQSCHFRDVIIIIIIQYNISDIKCVCVCVFGISEK